MRSGPATARTSSTCDAAGSCRPGTREFSSEPAAGPRRSRLDEQIDALEKLRDGLDSCIGCGCLASARCRLSNPQDAAGRAGSGAQ